MSRATPEAVAEFIAAHPDCKVSDVMRHFDVDGADAWELLIDAERCGFITMRQEHGDTGTWHFRLRKAATR